MLKNSCTISHIIFYALTSIELSVKFLLLIIASYSQLASTTKSTNFLVAGQAPTKLLIAIIKSKIEKKMQRAITTGSFRERL